MPNINKVVFGNQTLIDLSTTTLSSASQLESGVTAYARDGSVITGTGSSGGGGSVTQDQDGYIVIPPDGGSSSGTGTVVIEDTTDTAGGTIRTITAVDISDTTAVAADVASGKYFYDASGVKTVGTGSGGSSEGWNRPAKYPDYDTKNLTGFEGVYLTYDLSLVVNEAQLIISIYAQGDGYKQGTVERGHFDSSGVFVVDETHTTTSYKFEQQLDLSDGEVQIWRASCPETFLGSFRFNDFSVQSGTGRYQPCVEIYFKNRKASSSIAPTYTLKSAIFNGITVQSGCYEFLKQGFALEQVIFKNCNFTCTDYRVFLSNCYSLTKVDLSGVTLSQSAPGSSFNSLASLKKLIVPDIVNLSGEWTWMFNSDRCLEELDITNVDVSGITKINATVFADLDSLKTLKMTGLSFSAITTEPTFSFNTLENLYPPSIPISQTWNCKNLSHDSLVRLMNVLPNVQSTQTVTIGAFNISKLTAAEIAVATAKGWTVA